MARKECEDCGGTGLRIEERVPEPQAASSGQQPNQYPGQYANQRLSQQAGRPVRVAVPCDCQLLEQTSRMLGRAHVPRRYEHCLLEDFDARYEGADSSIVGAHMTARRFVETYPLETDGKGLMFVGSIGVGKTHLAIGILNALVQQKGARGLFCDYRDLLKQIQHSYNPQVAATEMEVLAPVFDAEVLVLDELGASKPTDWVWDTVAHILNTRYNDKRTTILTTNYPNLPSAATQETSFGRTLREETLGDRIGDRMRSRLMEMCVVISMSGKDFRQTVRRASFA